MPATIKVTIKDIAREAGVSTGTISRFINLNGYVSEDARERIKSAMKKVGYTSHVIRGKKTYQLGVLTSFSKDIFNSRYHTHILSGIISALYETEYNLKLILLKDKDYSNVQEMLREYAIDGLFILTWRIHPNLIRLIETCPNHLPVMIFNDYDPKLQVHCVYSDVALGMEMAVDYLSSRGRRKIAFLRGPSLIRFGSGKEALHVPSIDAYDKYEGFQMGMEKNQLEIRNEWIRECGAYTAEEGYLRTLEILKAEELPDALICSNDEIAFGALKALGERKIKCPDQMAVVGFDGIEKGELTTPPLTTVEQLLSSMGYEAGKKLAEIAGGSFVDPIHMKFVPRLLIRDSA
ncbi:MAG: LacI family DNA-binding transcriptional regulator [Candidatus Omnitrophica bacterium]|nr:LacI family DNA-binding transcriptional regulator [Candidatus Omnitrophota bacterium]